MNIKRRPERLECLKSRKPPPSSASGIFTGTPTRPKLPILKISSVGLKGARLTKSQIPWRNRTNLIHNNELRDYTQRHRFPKTQETK
jgi:hypothetical protein